MRAEEELRAKAVNLNRSLVNRAKRLGEMHAELARYQSGLGGNVSEDRIETLKGQIDRADTRQARDGLTYATLRWVMGITEEIDDANLGIEDAV
jgi:hypothetical protein